MKRLLDVVLSGLALIILAPVMAVVAVAILARMGRPILFRQPRVGYRERIFILAKFRTMSGESIRGREALDDEERLTPLGRFLRRSSLDELPQLWNVLRGDMSVVGPRPLLVDYLPLYSREQRRRHDVRPGMTGWAQINGRNAVSWDERFALDTWYAQHHSMWLDVKILARTAIHLLHIGGSAEESHRPMPRFQGSAESAR
jgi:sugar transferase EpsL